MRWTHLAKLTLLIIKEAEFDPGLFDFNHYATHVQIEDPYLTSVCGAGKLFQVASPNIPPVGLLCRLSPTRQAWIPSNSTELLFLLGDLLLECQCFLFPRMPWPLGMRICVECSCVCTCLTSISPVLYRMKPGQILFMNISLQDSESLLQKVHPGKALKRLLDLKELSK